MTADVGDPSAADEAPVVGSLNVPELQRLINRYFKVYEIEDAIRGLPPGEVAAFYIQIDKEGFNERFEDLRREVSQHDPKLLVILQHRLGEDIIIVARKPPTSDRGITLNVVLLILTAITTTLGGSLFYTPYSGTTGLIHLGPYDVSWLHPSMLAMGFLTFSLPLMAILGFHELGHYVVAKRHRVKTTLPYFIPVPPIVPIGTFGAFISIKEPIPDRKALFDIGASGPLVGFLLAIPVVILGMVLTATVAVPVPPDPELHLSLTTPVEGQVLGYNSTNEPLAATYFYNVTTEEREGEPAHVEQIFVALDEGGFPDNRTSWRLHMVPLNTHGSQTVDLRVVFRTNQTHNATDTDFVQIDNGTFEQRLELGVNETGLERPFTIPNHASNLSVEMAWTVPDSSLLRLGDSLLFLGLQWVVDKAIPVEENVFTHPTGIAGWVGLLVTGFNLLPAGQLDGGHVARAVLGERQKWASYAAIALMFALSFRFPGWLIMAVLIVFLGLQHPPPLNDRSRLDAKRRILAVIILVVLIITFVPFPFVEG